MGQGAPGVRSRLRSAGLTAGIVCLVVLCAGPPAASAASAANMRSRVSGLIRNAIAHHGIKAAIVQITIKGRTLMTRAYGQSMTGVPANPRMHFRNGAVAISYMSTLLLRLVDEGKVKLDDRASKWLPHLRDANRITLRELATMSAGYHDFEEDPDLDTTLYSNPFGVFTTQKQLHLMLDEPLQFKPGTNFSYAHSNYVVLGLILSKITHLPLNVALQRMVLRPLGLRNTVANLGPAMPSPVLHAYTSERRQFLDIPASTPFYEDATFWNPSWTLAHGAIETTNITDMTRTAIGIGTGRLLTRESYREMINPRLGFGHPRAGCERCQQLNKFYGYGIGAVRNAGWILQNPQLQGYGAIESYEPRARVSVSMAVTFKASSFDSQGNYSPYWNNLWAYIGKVVAPRNAPVLPSG